jgi:hypothetical protein
MAYQHTPRASKNNAFCWESYEPRIDWRAGEAQARGGATRSRQIEAQRAAGIDTLFIPGMGSSARQDPMTVTRIALAQIADKARHA